MKTSKMLFLLAAAVFVSLFLGYSVAQAAGVPSVAPMIAGALFLASFIPKGSYSFAVEAPDLSALTTAFVKFGGTILRKHVNKFNLGKGVTPYRSVKVPVAMTKLSATQGPRPYTAADNTGTGAAFTNRVLTVHQSKLDFDVDPEKYRNTFLNDNSGAPFYQIILDQVATEYMSAIQMNTVGKGVYNAAGTTAADIADGYITILKNLVTATTMTAIVIGSIDATNAVTKVETFAEAQPSWWKEQGFVIKCSYAVLEAYKKHYRTLNGFGFKPDEMGQYRLDGMNVILEPNSWMTGSGLLGVVFDAMAFGTDGDQIQVAASMRRNIIEVRLMMPIGFEFEDLDCISVSDALVA